MGMISGSYGTKKATRFRRLGARLAFAAMLIILTHGFFHPGCNHASQSLVESCENASQSGNRPDEPGRQIPEHQKDHCSLCTLLLNGFQEEIVPVEIQSLWVSGFAAPVLADASLPAKPALDTSPPRAPPA